METSCHGRNQNNNATTAHNRMGKRLTLSRSSSIMPVAVVILRINITVRKDRIYYSLDIGITKQPKESRSSPVYKCISRVGDKLEVLGIQELEIISSSEK